jgi:hypothetical protein
MHDLTKPKVASAGRAAALTYMSQAGSMGNKKPALNGPRGRNDTACNGNKR